MSELSIPKNILHAGIFAVAASMALMPAAVLAEEQGGGTSSRSTVSLDEIVVTAQKRVETAQSVPIAITAFSGESLEQDQLTTLTDLANSTPGLTFNPFGGGQPEIAIRGVGTKEDGPGAGDSTLVMVDGMYFASRTAANVDIFDLERVEVLRGPQGTLFGKNSIGGIINYVTKNPTDEFDIRIRQIVGNYGQFDTAAMVNLPVSEELNTRFVISRRAFDGYEKWVGPYGTGDSIGGDNLFSWRAQALWEPEDDLSILLSLDGADEMIGNDNREVVGTVGPLHDCGCASDPVAVNKALGGDGDPFTYIGENDNRGRREVFGARIEVNKHFESMTLTAIGGYRESEYDWVMDSTGLPSAPILDLTGATGNPLDILLGGAEIGFSFDNDDIISENSTQYTGEIRLASSGGESFEWVAGVFGSIEDILRTEAINFKSIADSSGVPHLAGSTMDFQGKSVAGFAQGTYHLTDDIRFTAGGRYSYEKKDILAFNEVPQSPDLQLVLAPFDPAKGSDSWKNFSWKAVADWQVQDDVLVYGSVTTGFKSGGYTGTATTAAVATKPFSPEKATNYELGIKGDFLDKRLRMNLSAFFLDYKDLQITRFFQPEGSVFGEFITENAANAEVKGLEFEFTALLSEQIEVGGFYAYLDAEFKDFFGTKDFKGEGDFSGNKLRQAPEHSLGGHIQYVQDLERGQGSITANVSAKYQSSAFTNVDNNALDFIPAYTVVDAWLAWNSSDDKWMVQAWIKNLTDTEYRTHVFTQRGGRIAFGTFGPPRTFGLTLQYTY